MTYEANDYTRLLGLKGFSKNLLETHFTLYRGYVKNTNTLVQEMAGLLREGRTATAEFAELNRRFGWEFNGMRLHEYYFGNLLPMSVKLAANSPLERKIVEDFGTLENWEKDFRAMGAMRGIGWVITYYEPIGRRMFNVWIGEHDLGHLSGAMPLLVMDMFEHAYMADYGLKRADYIQAFYEAIDWRTVQRRFDSAAAKTVAL